MIVTLLNCESLRPGFRDRVYD